MSDIEPHILKKLEQLAEDSEVPFAEIKEFFEALKIALRNTPENKGINDVKLQKRTYNVLEEHYQEEKFTKPKTVIFMPFGISSEAKDKNKKLREEIFKEWDDTPENRLDMIRGITGDGTYAKVMIMKVSDQEIGEEVDFCDIHKPVKNRESLKLTVVNDMTIVEEGDLWKPGDKIIPRDYRDNINAGKSNEYENKQFTKPLDPSWEIRLFGIGFEEGTKDVKVRDPESREVVVIKRPKTLREDGRIMKVKFRGDFAEPNNPNNVLKKAIFMERCILKGYETMFSDELFKDFTAKGSIEFAPLKEKEDPQKIVKSINSIINKKALAIEKLKESSDSNDSIAEAKKKKIDKLHDLYKKFTTRLYIPIIDLSEVDGYHKTHRAVMKKGKISKSEEGWDDTDFNSFALTEISYSGVYEKEGQAPKMIITDASLPDRESLFLKYSKGLPIDLPKCTALISITTSRGNQVYDKESETWVVDDEKATAIPKIKGIKMLYKFKDLEKILANIKENLTNKNLRADV